MYCNIRVINPPKMGEVVVLDANVVTYEDNVAFTEAIFTNSKGQIVAQGTHSIYVMFSKNLEINFK